MTVYDLIIIGAGPVGIELAVAAKRAGLNYLHLEKGQIGQTISRFPPMMRFFSSNERIALAGVPIQTTDQSKCSKEEYLAYLRQLVRQFDLRIHTYEPVTDIWKEGEGFAITTQTAQQRHLHHGRVVVLATGGTAQPRRLGIPGEDLAHVEHAFTDPHKYFQRRLLIVGGKNSAVEAALRCHHAGAEVAISYRQEAFRDKSVKYWLRPEVNGLIKEKAITGCFNTRLVMIRPAEVDLQNVVTGDQTTVPADHVLVLIGFDADMSLFEKAGVILDVEQQGPQFDPKTMETNVPGLYVAGTAVAGTQRSYKIFLENCHVHCDKIVAALTGRSVPPEPAAVAEPEA